MALKRGGMNVWPLLSPKRALKQGCLGEIRDSWVRETAAAFPSVLESEEIPQLLQAPEEAGNE